MPMLIWGLAYVWVKVVYKYYGPFTTTFIRLSISGTLLILISVIFKKFDRIRKEDILLLFIFTIVDPLGYFVCESMGLTHISALVGSIIISTIPVFSAILGYFILRERLSVINIFGAMMSFAGIGIMIFKPDLSFTASPLGLILMFGAVGCAIIYSVIVKRLSERYNVFTLVTIQNTCGAIYFFPLFLIFESHKFLSITPNYELISNMLLLAVLGSTAAFLIYVLILIQIGIARTNMFINLIPVFTLIASWFILGDIITFKNFIGMSIVITGLYLSQIKKELRMEN
jgi:drug/metabolite transporter (DMT)-like permease